MKGRQLEILVKKYLLPSFPYLAVKGSLVFFNNINLLLRGFCFEASAFDKNSYKIILFVQPLYVLHEYIVLSISQELGFLTKGREIWWNLDDNIENIMREINALINLKGIAWLDSLNSIHNIIGYVQRESTRDDIQGLRVIAYSYLMLDKYNEALKCINKIEYVVSSDVKAFPWMTALMNEVICLRNLIVDNPKNGKNQLMDFRNKTLNDLKLSKWAIEPDKNLSGLL